MPKACEHGLKLNECFTCASPKHGEAQMRDELQDLRNWGALVFPALDEAAKVIATIEGEYLSEQDDLDRLVAKLKDLARHYVVVTQSGGSDADQA